MFPWYTANPDSEHTTRNKSHGGEDDHEVAAGYNGCRPSAFDVHAQSEQATGLTLVELLLSAFDRPDKVASFLQCFAHAAEHVQLDRGVHHSGDDEHEDDRWGDQEQFAVEAHAGN